MIQRPSHKDFALSSDDSAFVLCFLTLCLKSALSDVDGDRQLDCEEFSIAKFLITGKLQGQAVPDVLPSTLMPEREKWDLTTEQKQQYAKEFTEADTDQDGIISGI